MFPFWREEERTEERREGGKPAGTNTQTPLHVARQQEPVRGTGERAEEPGDGTSRCTLCSYRSESFTKGPTDDYLVPFSERGRGQF